MRSERIDVEAVLSEGVLWAVSASRVALAVARREVFGAQASLAAMAVLAASYALGIEALSWTRRRREARQDDRREAPSSYRTRAEVD